MYVFCNKEIKLREHTYFCTKLYSHQGVGKYWVFYGMPVDIEKYSELGV